LPKIYKFLSENPTYFNIKLEINGPITSKPFRSVAAFLLLLTTKLVGANLDPNRRRSAKTSVPTWSWPTYHDYGIVHR